MHRVTYSLGASLDGYIVGPDGAIPSPPPDEEVFRFVMEEIRGVGVHLMGRRLYETMLYWERVDHDPPLDGLSAVAGQPVDSSGGLPRT